MSKAVWMVFAVGAMIGIFAACVVVVAAGVRAMERILIKRGKKSA